MGTFGRMSSKIERGPENGPRGGKQTIMADHRKSAELRDVMQSPIQCMIHGVGTRDHDGEAILGSRVG